MQAGCDQDGDVLFRRTSVVQSPQDGRKSDAIWRGASDIADCNGGGSLSFCEVSQRRACDGMIERQLQRGIDIIESESGPALDDFVCVT
jgi:hypothetical protein